jgi:WD40 repeat protein
MQGFAEIGLNILPFFLCIRFSSSRTSTLLACGSVGKSISVFAIPNTAVEDRFQYVGGLIEPCDVINGHTNSILDVCWAPSGFHLASAGKDHSIRVWTRKLQSSLPESSDASTTIADGSQQEDSVGSVGTPINKWKAAAVFNGHMGKIYSIAWVQILHDSGNQNLIFSSSDDQTVRGWRWDGSVNASATSSKKQSKPQPLASSKASTPVATNVVVSPIAVGSVRPSSVTTATAVTATATTVSLTSPTIPLRFDDKKCAPAIQPLTSPLSDSSQRSRVLTDTKSPTTVDVDLESDDDEDGDGTVQKESKSVLKRTRHGKRGGKKKKTKGLFPRFKKGRRIIITSTKYYYLRTDRNFSLDFTTTMPIECF